MAMLIPLNRLSEVAPQLDDHLHMLAEEIIRGSDFEFSEEEYPLAIQQVKYALLSQRVPPSAYLRGLKEGVLQEAQHIIDSQEMEGLTESQRDALVYSKALELLGGAELEVDLASGDILASVEGDGLFGDHPEAFSSIEAYAQAYGIKKSEAYNRIALSRVIFPFIRTRLGRDPREVYAQVKKARFARIIPLLKAIIDPSAAGLHAQSLRRAEAVKQIVLQTTPGVEDVQAACVEYVLEEAQLHTVASLEERLKALDGPQEEQGQGQEGEQEQGGAQEQGEEQEDGGALVDIIVRRVGDYYLVRSVWSPEQLEVFKSRLGDRAVVVDAMEPDGEEESFWEGEVTA